MSALELWSDPLGKAGPETGHSLAFVSHPPSSQHKINPYCCLDYNYREEGKEYDADKDLQCVTWNSNRYPSDALAIHWVDSKKMDGSTSASVGYMEGSLEGRNSLHISEGNDEPATIAHELGHSESDRDENYCPHFADTS